MQIQNSFEVPASLDVAWELVNDMTRIAPCMPGAEITDELGDGRYRGEASVKLGPVSLRFAGEAQYLERDENTHTVRLAASGRDKTGRGNARATITSHLVPGDNGTTVNLVTDLQLSGAVAQFGRQGIVSDVSNVLIGQFADCLSQQLRQPSPAADASAATPTTTPAPASTQPSVLLLLRSVIAGIVRRLRERFARRRRTAGPTTKDR